MNNNDFDNDDEQNDFQAHLDNFDESADTFAADARARRARRAAKAAAAPLSDKRNR